MDERNSHAGAPDGLVHDHRRQAARVPGAERRGRRVHQDAGRSGNVEEVAEISNAEIADRLTSLAQLLSAQKENPFKVKAYRRAAKTIRALSQSVDELVRQEADLTKYPGIGKAIESAIREIVLSGTL